MVQHTIRRKDERHHMAQILSNWFTTNVKKVGDFVHNNFQASFQANPLSYMG